LLSLLQHPANLPLRHAVALLAVRQRGAIIFVCMGACQHTRDDSSTAADAACLLFAGPGKAG
jgi:hypothetical protein